jgi:hypothetical protein
MHTPEPWSKASRIPRERVREFLREQEATPAPCEYGHIDCSNLEGGACMDELLNRFPEFAGEDEAPA